MVKYFFLLYCGPLCRHHAFGSAIPLETPDVGGNSFLSRITYAIALMKPLRTRTQCQPRAANAMHAATWTTPFTTYYELLSPQWRTMFSSLLIPAQWRSR